MSSKGYLLGPEQGVVAGHSDLKATRTATGGSLTVLRSRIASRRGEKAPLHVHSQEDESFYVLEGTITVRCGEETFEAVPGSFVFLPRGIAHMVTSASSEAMVLIISTPGGFDEFIRELHQAGPASDEVRDQIGAKYGITFVRPSRAP